MSEFIYNWYYITNNKQERIKMSNVKRLRDALMEFMEIEFYYGFTPEQQSQRQEVVQGLASTYGFTCNEDFEHTYNQYLGLSA